VLKSKTLDNCVDRKFKMLPQHAHFDVSKNVLVVN